VASCEAVTPAEQLGRQLAAARAGGAAFDAAWTAAVESVLAGVSHAARASWRDALDATAQRWESAWHRRSPTRAELALVAVAVDPERVWRSRRGNHAVTRT